MKSTMPNLTTSLCFSCILAAGSLCPSNVSAWLWTGLPPCIWYSVPGTMSVYTVPLCVLFCLCPLSSMLAYHVLQDEKSKKYKCINKEWDKKLNLTNPYISPTQSRFPWQTHSFHTSHNIDVLVLVTKMSTIFVFIFVFCRYAYMAVL